MGTVNSWRGISRRLWVWVGLCLALHGCRASVSGPAELVTGISSRISVRDARETLKGRVKEWKVLEDTSLPAKGERPAIHSLILSADGFSHLGSTGELLLFFYNDKLIATWFYPANIDSYMASLEAERGFHFGSARKVESFRGAKIWIATDKDKRAYVGWQDIELTAEQDEWIARYA